MLELAFFEFVPDGADASQVFDHFGDDLDDVVDLLHGVILADGEAQAAVGDLVGQADGKEDVTGVQGAGGAGAAGRGADALVVQHEQEALALDALKAHVHGAGDMMLETAVDLAVGDLAELGEELVTHGDDLRGVLRHMVAALLQGGGHGDDAGDVLGPGALAALLGAAVDDIREDRAALGVEDADPLRGVELVAGHGEHVDVHGFDIDGHVAGGLDRVGMEEDLPLTTEGADLGDGLDGADLVVGKHDGDEAGVVPQGVRHVLDKDDAVGVRVEERDLEALLLEAVQGMEDGVVLKHGGDDMPLPFPGAEAGRGDDGLVIGLAAAGGEGDLLRVGVEVMGNGLTGGLQGLLRLLAEGIETGGVSIQVGQVGQHGVEGGLAHAGGGRIIGVDEHVIPSFYGGFFGFTYNTTKLLGFKEEILGNSPPPAGSLQ